MVISMMGDDIAYARKANAAGLAVQALSTGVFGQPGKEDCCSRLPISLAKAWRSRWHNNYAML